MNNRKRRTRMKLKTILMFYSEVGFDYMMRKYVEMPITKILGE